MVGSSKNNKTIKKPNHNKNYIFRFDNELLDVLTRIGYLKNNKVVNNNINVLDLKQWLLDNGYVFITNDLFFDKGFECNYCWKFVVLSELCYTTYMYICDFISKYGDGKEMSIFKHNGRFLRTLENYKVGTITGEQFTIDSKSVNLTYNSDGESIYNAICVFLREFLIYDNDSVLDFLNNCKKNIDISNNISNMSKNGNNYTYIKNYQTKYNSDYDYDRYDYDDERYYYNGRYKYKLFGYDWL